MAEETEQVVDPDSLPAATPRGWYPDPFDRAKLRWWDGDQWTTHASPSGATITTDPDPSLPDPSPDEPDRHRGLVGLATVVLLVVAAFLPFRCGEDDPTEDASAPASEAVDSSGSEDQEVPSDENSTIDGDGVGGEIPEGRADGEDSGSGATLEESDGSSGNGSAGGSYWEDPGLGRLRVVYLVEVNDGQTFERIIASDDPRQVRRDPGMVDYHDDVRSVQCFDGNCVASDFNGGSIRRFTVFSGERYAGAPDRTVAGRDAFCEERAGFETCYDIESGVLLLRDPGEEAMQQSDSRSERTTAVSVGDPQESDFEFPFDVESVDPG